MTGPLPTSEAQPEMSHSVIDVQLAAMRLLHEEPALSQRVLAERLGISLGKAHYVLRALLDKGWIKVNNFRRSDKKLAYAYLLTPAGVSEKMRLASQFLARKEQEYESLKLVIESLRREVRSQKENLQ
jgi:EPS-associated MarR family transcriptional regulator